MSAQPLVALAGGDEFTEAAEAFDRELLALVEAKAPNVAILPTAAKSENPFLAAAHGITHFRKLGADPYGVMIVDKVTADAPVLVSELAGADIVYLTGGNPANLLEGLQDSRAWQKLLEMADDGAVIAGSSAGAMVLGERMAFGGEESDALGLVAGVIVLPHFERADAVRIEQLVKAAPEGMTYLGIDGATGCLRTGGEWRVTGPGRLQVITRDGVEVVKSGGVFQLP